MFTNNVIVVAGGPWQIPLVRFLQNKGHAVHVVNPKVTETTKVAQGHIVADVNDIHTIMRAIKPLNPRFITSDQSDISTMSVARLCEYSRLPGNYPSVIEKFTNKHEMFLFAKRLGLSVPETRLATSADELRTYVEEHGLPVVIKPPDATNSRGLRKLESTEGLEEAFETTRNYSKMGKVLIQDFVPGSLQVTLDGVCSGGKHKTLAVSNKGLYYKPGLTSCVSYPAKIGQDLMARLVADNDRYVEQSGLSFGLTHGEYIIDQGRHFMIEIAARGAGAGITDKITPWTSGVHPYEILHRSLLGDEIDVRSLKVTQRPAILYFYHEDEMSHCTPEKVDRIRQIPGVASFQYNFRGDQFATDPYNPRHSMGIYLAETEEQLGAIMMEVALLICK